jgi:hypothetical protein
LRKEDQQTSTNAASSLNSRENTGLVFRLDLRLQPNHH